jgi:DNA-binding XRE family transcriptional regulator
MDRKVQVKFKKVKLAEVRQKLDLTQEKAAKHLGIAQGDLSKLESGKKVPDWFHKAIRLHSLLKEAGYSLDDLAIPPYDDGEN